MQVVMCGYQNLGPPTPRTLIGSRHEVVGVVAHPTGGQVYEHIWADRR